MVSEVRYFSWVMFSVALVALAFETILFRGFTFLFGYHFVSLLVAVALLGYGIAGSIFAQIPTFFKNYPSLGMGMLLLIFLVAFTLFPFDVYEVMVKPQEFLLLGILLLLTLLPFLIHGLIQVIVFERFPQFFPRFYALNLLGSASGIGVGLWLLGRFEEGKAVLPLCLIGLLERMKWWWRVLFLGVWMAFLFSPLHMYLSPYSPSRALNQIPETSLLITYRHPAEVLEVFSVPSLRLGWGLSMNFRGIPPSGWALVFDHHAMELFPGEISGDFLEALLLSLPFRFLSPRRALVMEEKSGLGVYVAEHFGASEIEFLTSSFLFARFLREWVPGFPARVMVTSPRYHLLRSREAYDYIHVHVPVSRASIFPGSFSFKEDFLFTMEGMRELFFALREGGLLSFSLFLQNPPSVLPKLVTILASAYGHESLRLSLIVVKNLDYALCLVKKGGWSKEEVRVMREECREQCFDFIYFPGGDEGEMETIFHTERRYAHLVRRILEEKRVESLFDLRPNDDHRPYFTNFFRFSQLKEAWWNLGKRWLPFGGAGFLLVLAVIGTVILLSVFGLLWPVRAMRKRGYSPREKLLLGGSICTGVGFMFLEISLFVRLTLFVGLPLYTFSLLLLILLVGSGWGSWQVGRSFLGSRPKFAALSHLILLGGYLLLLTYWGHAFLSMPIVAVLPIVAVAFVSGFPFPLLSEATRLFSPSLFPIIFAYNGFFSVVSSLLAHLVMIFWGVGIGFLITFWSYGMFWWLLLRFSSISRVSPE